jgi:L-ornithine Nalpha-acyltransferase
MRGIASISPKPRRLSVRLASTAADIEAAKRLRWDVFYRERGATPLEDTPLDRDPYDPVCDHLLVEDSTSGTPEVIGTYRLLRQSVAASREGFYSASEYDLAPLSRSPGEQLELGRSCVAAA